jgi:hypothetical protein
LLSPPPGHEEDPYWRLNALVREGVQVLERAGLVLYQPRPPGLGTYRITRLGQEALQTNTISRIIDEGSG